MYIEGDKHVPDHEVAEVVCTPDQFRLIAKQH